MENLKTDDETKKFYQSWSKLIEIKKLDIIMSISDEMVKLGEQYIKVKEKHDAVKEKYLHFKNLYENQQNAYEYEIINKLCAGISRISYFILHSRKSTGTDHLLAGIHLMQDCLHLLGDHRRNPTNDHYNGLINHN